MSLPLQKGRLGRGLASLIGEAPAERMRRCPRTASSACCRSPSCIRAASIRARISTSTSSPSSPSRSAPRAWCSRSSPGPIAQRGGYEIVAGERRWRAAQQAPLHNVPVIVRELSDQDVAEFAVIENVQRNDLNPIEEAVRLLAS